MDDVHDFLKCLLPFKLYFLVRIYACIPQTLDPSDIQSIPKQELGIGNPPALQARAEIGLQLLSLWCLRVLIRAVADLRQTTRGLLPVSFLHCSAGSQPLKKSVTIPVFILYAGLNIKVQ
jgi:hypothetical protein